MTVNRAKHKTRRGAAATLVVAFAVMVLAMMTAPSQSAAQSAITATVTVLPPGELLAISAIRQGNVDVYPGGAETPVLVFRLDNHFVTPKTITGVTLRDASRGAGTAAERLTNIDSVSLYLDLDGDFWVSPGDSLLARAALATTSISLSFSPVTLQPDSGRTFVAAITPSLYPRDRDSLDLFFYRATDLATADATVPEGPDSINSFGYNIVDGMTAAQIAYAATGATAISPVDGLVPAFAVDIPRNGYAADTLQVFSVANYGSAPRTSIDSLVLYADNGNGTWGGAGEESRLGRLSFTGGLWSLSGLAWELSSPTTRFYLGVVLPAYPVNAATLHFGIPQNGLQMRSANDGPIDVTVRAPDTLVIQSLEALAVTSLAMPQRILIPGQPTPPLLAFELRNSYAADVALDSLRLALFATDPGGASQAQLDGQFDSLLLYLDLDGNPAVIGAGDVVLGRATLSAGTALFRTPGLGITGGGGDVRLATVAFVCASQAKNGNSINFAVAGPGDLFTSPATSPGGAFPILNPVDHRVEAFPASRIAVSPVPGTTLFGGEIDRPMMQFRLPSNGYALDTLVSLRLVTNGTFADAPLYVTPRLWQDVTGDGLTVDDLPLGAMSYSGATWRIDNLAVPIQNAGLSIVVTIDIANVQFDGGTLQLAIPRGGVAYRSGADGPDDLAVPNPELHLVLPPNRVTAIPIVSPTVTVVPGSADNVLLAFALYNGYLTQAKTLSGLRFTNASRTRSTPAWADVELGQVSLYLDSDGDGMISGDSLIGTGNFAAGELHLSGLAIDLLPESLVYLYVVTQIPLSVIDSDSLDVAIGSPADFEFTSAVVMNGDVPLRDGGYLVVDGSVNAQYELPGLSARTLRPGDTDVVLFAFRPAANGGVVDTLHSLTLTNLAFADGTDIARLSAWLDMNQDGIWQGTDSLLGDFGNFGSDWVFGSLDLEVTQPSPMVLITGDVAVLATPNRAFQAAIPLNGCQYTSANDGPRDVPVGGSDIFTISTSGLRIAQTPLASGYTVGQTIELRARVTNVLGTTMDSVLGSMLYINDSGLVSLDSAQIGPVSLGAGAFTDFVWYYRALSPGTTFWRLRAEAPGIPDSSAAIQTGAARIQASAGPVFVRLINSMPTAVTRGQVNVFPLSVSYAHPDTALATAPLRLDSLRLDVEDAAGAPLSAGTVFSRIALFAGAEPVAVRTSVPAQSSVWLHFASPVIVAPGESETYSLLVDITPNATAADFVLGLTSAASVPLADANTGQSLAISGGVPFPLKTASCAVVDPSRSMAVSYRPLLGARLNYGQDNVAALKLLVRHPGPPGSSQIQLSSLRLAIRDAGGSGILASDLFSSVYLVQGAGVIGQLPPTQFGYATVAIPLNLPVTLSPGQVDSVTIMMAVRAASSVPGFQIAIADSSHFTVRDLSSGAPIEAGTDTVLATGLVFPILSGWTTLQAPAVAPEACLTSALPPGILSGVDSLPLLNLVLSQPDGINTSGTRVTSIRVMARDSLGNTLDPNSLFDRLGVRFGSGPIWYQPFVEVAAGAAIFRFTDSSVVLFPGDSATVSLVGDIEADVPYDHIALRVVAETDFDVTDAVDTARSPGLVAQTGCTGFPFQTAYTQIFLPAGRPTVIPRALPLQISFPGQNSLEMFTGDLSYVSTLPQADLAVRALSGELHRRTADGTAPASTSALFTAVRLLANGLAVATDSTLAGSMIDFNLPADYGVANGTTVDLAVEVDIRSDAPLGNYVLSFADSTFLDVRETNQFLRVFPILSGGPYPVWSTEISLSVGNLENSFSNYPNPFVPSRGEITTLAYVLEEDAEISVELFTTTGIAVTELASGQFRAAGAYSDLTWTGSNGKGYEVAPGVYICRFTARYTSGRVGTVTRRIAVVR